MADSTVDWQTIVIATADITADSSVSLPPPTTGPVWTLHEANKPMAGDTQQVCTLCGTVLMIDYPGRLGWLQAGTCSYSDIGPTLTVGTQHDAVPCTPAAVAQRRVMSAFAVTPEDVAEWRRLNPRSTPIVVPPVPPVVETTATRVEMKRPDHIEPAPQPDPAEVAKDPKPIDAASLLQKIEQMVGMGKKK